MDPHQSIPGGATPSGGDFGTSDRRDLFDDLKSLPYDVLFPVTRWLEDRPWDLWWVRALLFFALFPLVITVVFPRGTSLDRIAGLIALYFASLWAIALYYVIRPTRLHVLQTALVWLFTVVIGTAIVLTVQTLPPFNVLYAALQTSMGLVQLVGWVAGVGVCEEVVKALPVLWLVLKARTVRSPRDAAFLGGISGLAFGVAEAGRYSLSYAIANYLGRLDYGQYLSIQTLRFVTLPFFHCMLSTVVGYYVGLAGVVPSRARALMVVGIGLAAGAHGLYNFLANQSGWLSLVVVGVLVLVFISYGRSAEALSGDLIERLPPMPVRGEPQPLAAGAGTPAGAALSNYGVVLGAALDELAQDPLRGQQDITRYPMPVASADIPGGAWPVATTQAWVDRLRDRVAALESALPPEGLTKLHEHAVALLRGSEQALRAWLAGVLAASAGNTVEAQRYQAAAESWRPRVAAAHDALRDELTRLRIHQPYLYAALGLRAPSLTSLGLAEPTPRVLGFDDLLPRQPEWRSDSTARCYSRYDGSEYAVAQPAEASRLGCPLLTRQAFRDFEAAFEARLVTSPEASYVAVGFRCNEQGGYYGFADLARGQGLLVLLMDGAWRQLTDWAPARCQGNTVRLGVRASSDELTLLVEGEAVCRARDATLRDGCLALGLYSAQASPGEVRFAHLAVVTPDAGGLASPA